MSYISDSRWTSRDHAASYDSRGSASSETYDYNFNYNNYMEDYSSETLFSTPSGSYSQSQWPGMMNNESPQAPSPSGTTSAYSELQDDSAISHHTVDARESRVCHCGKTFRRPSDLSKHQKYHMKHFSCLFSGCERAFATQKDLSRHARTHRKGEEGWVCVVEGCRKASTGHVYSRKDNFDRHMRTAHSA